MPSGQQELWWGGGIVVGHSQDVEIYGNTVTDNVNGIGAIQTSRGTGAHGAYEVRNMNVHHNTVTQSNGGFAGGIIHSPGYDAVYTWGNVWANNTYHLSPNQNVIAYAWAAGSLDRFGWQSAGNDTAGVWP